MALLAGIALLVVLLFSCLETVPKEGLTLGNISSLGLQVHLFYETNHHLPRDLEEVKADPKFRNDAWGRPIAYVVTSSNTYTLRSFGPRGEPGRDNMTYAFDAADLSGTPVR